MLQCMSPLLAHNGQTIAPSIVGFRLTTDKSRHRASTARPRLTRSDIHAINDCRSLSGPAFRQYTIFRRSVVGSHVDFISGHKLRPSRLKGRFKDRSL